MKMIQIRNVPDELHRTLKARAARGGMSLSDYLLAQLAGLAERPTTEEVLERIARRPRAELDVDAATAVREEREARR
jgi:plasmid stability protein